MSFIKEALLETTEDIPSSRLEWPGADEDQLAFMQRVYDINKTWSARNGTFIADIPDSQLSTIEDRHKARTEAALACKELLVAARKAIANAGVKVKIGITSGYRSATRQLSLWQSYFPDYYENTTAHREKLPGGAHGEEAVNYLGGYIRSKVAIPGYSNHQNGIAVDLLNIENDKKVENKTKSPFPAQWRESWLWKWLEENANKFGLYQNNSINEPWHWEYKKKDNGSQEIYEQFEYTEEDSSSSPVLIHRESTPATETFYVEIDLGMTHERIYKKTDTRDDTARVEKKTGIFIPKNFAAAPEADILIYLHGHKSFALGKEKSIDNYWKKSLFPHFAFREFLNDSGRQIILVAPTLGPRSQAGTLITNTGFTNFMNQVMSAIGKYSSAYAGKPLPTVKNIILACHSGGGSPMRRIAMLAGANKYADKINKCWGFDCTYSDTDADEWPKWAKANSDRSLAIYYLKDGDTEPHATALKKNAASISNVQVLLSAEGDHNLVPKKYFTGLLGGNTGAPITAPITSEYARYHRRRPLVSLARDLFYRRYISYPIYIAISNGERDADRLTDMVFSYRHPSWGSMFDSSDADYDRLKKEWQEIRSKMIEPLIDGSEENGSQAEISTGRPRPIEPLQANKPIVIGHDDVQGRIKWFNESRFESNRRVREDMMVAFKESVETIRRLKRTSGEQYLSEDFIDIEKVPLATKNNWSPLGPSSVDNGQGSSSINLKVSGRITSIAAGPSSTRVYIGTANGGVWFTANGGNYWEPLDDFADSPSYKTTTRVDQDALSIGSIDVRFGSKREEDEIYVGTGEAVGGYLYVFGVGIKHSVKGGTPGSWKLEAKNLMGKGIYKIVIDPLDNKKVYAATTDGLYQRPATGFDTWTKIRIGTTTGATTDFLVAGSGTTRTYYAAVLHEGVYKSNDLTTWSIIAGITKNSFTMPGTTNTYYNPERIALIAGEVDPSIVYAFHQFYRQSGSGSSAKLVFDTRLYRLVSGSFVLVTGLPSVFNGGGQGSYNVVLGVDPADDDTVYIAGNYVDDKTGEYPLSLFKSKLTSPTAGTFSFGFTNSASPFSDATFVGTNLHADGHVVAFALNAAGTKKDATKVWIGSDGGVFFSDKRGVKGSFDAKNHGLAITQMTYLAQHPNIPSVVFAGCQDNGTLRYWGEQVWYESPKGDGGGIAVDPNNPYNLISQYTETSLSTNSDGGITNSWSRIKFPPTTSSTKAQTDAAKSESDDTRFYGPIAVSPDGVSPTMLGFGTTRLWLSLDWGKTWTTLPTNTNPYSSTTPLATQDNIGTITSIKIVSSTRIYATTSTNVHRYDLSSGTWTRVQLVTNGLPATGYFITAIEGDPADNNNCYVALGGSADSVRCFYFDNGTSKWYPVGPPKDILKIHCHAVIADPANPGTIYLGSDVGVWKLIRNGSQLTWSYEQYSNGLPEVVITDLILHKKGRLLRAATHGRGVWEIAIDKKTSPPIDLYLRANYADDGRINPVTKKRFDFIKLADNPRTAAVDSMNLDGSPDITIMLLPFNNSAEVFVQINNRGYESARGANIRVLLLMTNNDASTTPILPADLAKNVIAGNATPGWLGSKWKFADKTSPFKTSPASPSARISSMVHFTVDLSVLDLTKGHYVSMVAIITTIDKSEQFKGTETDLDKMVISDKQIAYKKIFVP